MNRASALLVVVFALGLATAAHGRKRDVEPTYTIAFASFAPLDTDLFVAEPDGSNATPLLASAGFDYNASFSQDGRWIVFTSDRGGSADIYRARPDGSGLTRLTDDPAFDDQGALSPDGRFLAFVSSRSGQSDIWILTLANGRLRNVTRHLSGDFRPSWSPDGRWIAFSSDRDSRKPKDRSGFGTAHSTEIYLVRPDGSNVRRVTRDRAFAGSPTWSADGRRLAFYQATLDEVWNIVAPRRLRGVTQIVTVHVETGVQHVETGGTGEKWSPRWLRDGRIGYVSGGPEGGLEVTSGPDGARGEFRSPSWSPDGRRVVFHRDVEKSWPPHREWRSSDPRFRLVRTGVYPSFSPAGDRMVSNDKTAGILHNSILAMNADGSHRSVLFSHPEKSALAPVWSPQGDRVAFALGRFFQSHLGPAVADIAVVRGDGTELKLLTDGSNNYGFPSWSPDGRRIVFRSSSDGKSTLHIVDVDTGTITKLVTGSDKDNFPVWSPAGDLIAFTSYRNGDYDLYAIRPDGTGLRRLTNAPGNEAHCTWSPDGQWIAFASARGGFKDEAALHPYNPQPYGDLYVMRANGSEVRHLTDNQFEEATPSWMP